MMSTTSTGAPPSSVVLPELDQVQAHFEALSRPGEVHEVRVLGHEPANGYGGPATLSGYFDNSEALREAVRKIGADRATGFYITQNPVESDLLARANNRLIRKPKSTTADADIIRLAHITFDFDPVRKSGISATDAELAAALALRDTFSQFVTSELGWPAPLVKMMSGNGGQATWRIDLPLDRDDLVAGALTAASALFSTAAVSVDTTLGNPSRIVKLSGTTAAKGDPLPHRPHRQAQSTFRLDAGTATAAQLRTLVALAPEPERAPASENGHRTFRAGVESYDVLALLRAAGIGFQEREKDYACIFALDRCLSSDDHTDGAAILQFPSGAVAYTCRHHRCQGIGWQDVKHRLGIRHGDAGEATRAGNNDSTPHADAGKPEDARGARQEAPWPVLHDAAYYGLASEVVHAVDPHTEGDPVAILFNFLTMFGSAAGPSPHARVGAAKHRANEFAVQVGRTARGRKGTAHKEAERIVAGADQHWKPRIMGGLSSGEGLIFQVRDPSYKLDKEGNEVLADKGVDDKRLLVVEPEFSSVMRVAGRDGNVLSEQLRRAWDGDDLRTLTKNSPLCATAPHISLLGHITRDELLRELTETSQGNGFANRFLFLCVRRSKELPHGGLLPDFALVGLIAKVRKALDLARRRGAIYRDAEANAMWEAVYSALTAERPGMFGAITARAEAHVLRLSLIYALLDGGEAIRAPHLEAALAIWQYAEDSAKFIFGDATGDPIADRVLSALRTNGSMTQNEIVDLFGRHVSAARLGAALETLVQAGKIRSTREVTGGRPRTMWEAVP